MATTITTTTMDVRSEKPTADRNMVKVVIHMVHPENMDLEESTMVVTTMNTATETTMAHIESTMVVNMDTTMIEVMIGTTMIEAMIETTMAMAIQSV